MATEKPQCVRITRAAAKRSATTAEAELPAMKKRAVLGEITNLSEPISSVDPIKKPKRAAKTKKVKKAVTKLECDEKRDANAASEDPQICGPYVSDIYAYLHKMEVIGNWNFSVV